MVDVVESVVVPQAAKKNADNINIIYLFFIVLILIITQLDFRN